MFGEDCICCDSLERQIERLEARYEREIERLETENSQLRDALTELQYRMEGLDK